MRQGKDVRLTSLVGFVSPGTVTVIFLASASEGRRNGGRERAAGRE